MLTKEELMQPRYKVIADYPNNKEYPVGKVITILTDCYAVNDNGHPVFYCEFEEYPHLFKPIKWWEDRKQEDMPEYVKEVEDEIIYVYKSGKDFKYLTRANLIGLKMKDDKRMIHYRYLQPSTLEEYQSYTNSLK